MTEYIKKFCNIINDITSIEVHQSVMYTHKVELLYTSLAGKKEIVCIDIPWTITAVIKSSILEDVKSIDELDNLKEHAYIVMSASTMINNVEVNVFIGIRRIESYEKINDNTINVNINIHD